MSSRSCGVAGLLGDDREHAGRDVVGCRGRRGRLGHGLGGGRDRLGDHRRAPAQVRRPAPARIGRRGRSRASVDHAQAPIDDLEAGRLGAADPAQPRRPLVRVGDPVGVTELFRVAAATVGHRRPAQQQHADLGPEPRGQPQRVADRVRAAVREVQLAQGGVDLAEVRHGRDDAGLERLDRDHVLDPDAHRVARQALGVGDDDAVGGRAEDLAQRVDLRGGAAAARRRVGLV